MAELLRRRASPGFRQARLARPGGDEYHLLLTPRPGEPAGALWERLGDALGDELDPVRVDVFGAPEGRAAGLAALAAACGEVAWPVTWCADGFAADAVSQVQVHAVAGPVVRSVRLDGRVVGRLYEHERVCCAVFGDLQPRDRRAPPGKQAQQAFEMLEAALAEAGLALAQVVRLWLHVDQILDWYDELNAVRNGFFASRGLFDQLLPASTAVGASNHAGTALCIGAWAMGIPADVGSVAEVPSPLQGSPRDYGAALSRAVELTLPGCRRLLISGTNSIGRDGTSVRGKHAGEQAERTLDVLAALLESRGMSFAQVLRAGVYVRDEGDLPAVRRVLAERGLGELPAVAVGADICRPELRFEMELDAVAPARL